MTVNVSTIFRSKHFTVFVKSLLEMNIFVTLYLLSIKYKSYVKTFLTSCTVISMYMILFDVKIALIHCSITNNIIY